MTHEASGTGPPKFVTAVLPWLIGAVGLVIYAVTLNSWVSLHSVANVARIAGWNWQPELHQPLTAVALFPFRLLPAASVPLALNLFTAVGAALVLGLLARSVALWPHDRTLEQRWRGHGAILSTPTAWLPPVLAAMACGLQLTFWEHATCGTGEMINLLVFAAVIWCLFEFRICAQQRWLSRSAFLYAAGATNNWLLIGYFPFYLTAILWLKGLGVLNARFLLRLSLWGLAGLGFYLLLPTLTSFSSTNPVDFWLALKANLKSQRAALGQLPAETDLVLALISWLPLLVICIRWKSTGPHAGDDSARAWSITNVMFHLLHAVFLGVSLWIALDPPFSPRNLGMGATLLTQYYISALVVGYCAGYLLFIGTVPPQIRGLVQRTRGLQKAIAGPIVAAFCLLLGALPLALGWRNLGQIRTTNGPALRQFARQLCAGLPNGKSVVLSDGLGLLLLAQAELAGNREGKDALLLDTRSLPQGAYQIFMARRFGSRWPVTPPTNRLAVMEPLQLVHLVSSFATQSPVIYLHPSFGYYFERFTAQPEGLVQHLVPRTPGDTFGPTLDEQAAATQEQFWQQCWGDTLQALAARAGNPDGNAALKGDPLSRHFHLVAEQNATESFLRVTYSKSLDWWAVQMQRLGHWPEAGRWFQRALDLHPDNLAAKINLEFNQQRQQSGPKRPGRGALENQFPQLVGRYRTWPEVLSEGGPIDEPAFLFESGCAWFAGGNYHQAAAELARCAELSPDWPEPQLWLAQSLVALQDFPGAVRLTDRFPGSNLPEDGMSLAQFLFCRYTALQGWGRTNEAAAFIKSFVAQHGARSEMVSVAAGLFIQNRQFESPLAMLEEALRREPGNVELLSSKGVAEMQLSRFDDALRTLTAALSLQPSNQVTRLNRAIAGLRAGEFGSAQIDYRQLLKSSPDSPRVLFGLGEIAWRTHDTNAAIHFYRQCLSNCVPHSADYRLVSHRLKEAEGR